jgi:outer membrane protein OmpA-like peptidoglycan-associated protein
VADAKRNGVSTSQLKEAVAELAKLKAKGIATDTAKRDAEIVDSISTVMPNVRDRSVSSNQIASIIKRGLGGQGSSGHQWPPIINLSEAGGYRFKSGSAELSPEFRNSLSGSIPLRILERIKEYDVDVVEVVGHTDEQPLGVQQSNLDRDLLPVLKGYANVASLSPADNAGLGFARAVSVVSVLLQSPLLSGYRVLPLSGAQLINNDETLATSGLPVDNRERRRIEIRLRKSTPHDTTMPTAQTAPAAPAAPARPELPRPRPKNVAPSSPFPPPTTSSPIFPFSIWPNR